ncbi:hypothetical protein V8C86DRAFT_2562902 [Haematococcus lacustris]
MAEGRAAWEGQGKAGLGHCLEEERSDQHVAWPTQPPPSSDYPERPPIATTQRPPPCGHVDLPMAVWREDTVEVQDENERECVAGARRVFQLSLTASSLALDLQRLELACAFLLTDRLWAVAMADLAQLAVGLHANTAQRRLLTTPSALYSPRPASLSPTASGPTAMGGQQGPGWVEKLEPFWQLFVTYVVEATAGTEHNLAWWMVAVKAGNAFLPDLVNQLQRAQPMNAKMLVGAAAQYVQEVSGAAERGPQGQGGSRGIRGC